MLSRKIDRLSVANEMVKAISLQFFILRKMSCKCKENVKSIALKTECLWHIMGFDGGIS